MSLLAAHEPVDPRVVMIGRAIPHHAMTSGYHQIAVRMGYELRWSGGLGNPLPGYERYINNWYRPTHAAQEGDLARAAQRGVWDVIHFLYGDSNCRVVARHVPTAVKVTATFHQPPSVLETLGIDDEVISSLAGIIVLCTSQVRFFEARAAKRIKVLAHGIDCGFFNPGSYVRSPYDILTVGDWMRDYDLYFRIVLRAHRKELPFRFTVISQAPLLRNSSLPPNVNHIVRCTDLELLGFYQRSSCGMFPLLDATANNALLEALACGLPCLASDVGGTSEYLDPSVNILLKTADVDAWLGGLERLTSTENTLRSLNARANALRFSWSTFRPALSQLYRELL